MAQGHHLAPPTRSPSRRPVGVDAQASQLLKDDLDLAVDSPMSSKEGDIVLLYAG